MGVHKNHKKSNVKTSLPKATAAKGRKRIAKQTGKKIPQVSSKVEALFPVSGLLRKTIQRIKAKQRKN